MKTQIIRERINQLVFYRESLYRELKLSEKSFKARILSTIAMISNEIGELNNQLHLERNYR